MAGRDLVSPAGERFSPERLRGLAWRAGAEDVRDAARARRMPKQRQLVRAVVVDLADYRAGLAGAAA